jgi:hypothetical protein
LGRALARYYVFLRGRRTLPPFLEDAATHGWQAIAGVDEGVLRGFDGRIMPDGRPVQSIARRACREGAGALSDLSLRDLISLWRFSVGEYEVAPSRTYRDLDANWLHVDHWYAAEARVGARSADAAQLWDWLLHGRPAADWGVTEGDLGDARHSFWTASEAERLAPALQAVRDGLADGEDFDSARRALDDTLASLRDAREATAGLLCEVL